MCLLLYEICAVRVLLFWLFVLCGQSNSPARQTNASTRVLGARGSEARDKAERRVARRVAGYGQVGFY